MNLAIILVISLVCLTSRVKAYAYIRTVAPAGNFQPTSDSRIKNPANSWGVGIKPSYLTGYDPWIYDMGQYFSVSNVSGTYLSVTADYYIGISFNTADVAFLDSYLNTDRDPLKSTNLRCGLGSSYASGYSSIYAPSVTNFSVTLTEAENPSGNNYHYTYHIKYNYFQQIQRVTGYSGNASCWFEREPSNGLIAQINKIITGTTEFYYYNQTFNVNLSLDPNTAILDSIEGQNNTIIDQNNQTNQKLDDIYNEDIGDEYKELPDDSEYQDYTNTEDSLKDKVNQADLSNLSIGIDSKSSSWVWDTLTSFINSHSVIFGMFIAILSIGIIKLALGR